jgi:hypothetical protein
MPFREGATIPLAWVELGPSAPTAASQNLWIERHRINPASDCSGLKADESFTRAADIATVKKSDNDRFCQN